mgnify:CR=1 FL=1
MSACCAQYAAQSHVGDRIDRWTCFTSQRPAPHETPGPATDVLLRVWHITGYSVDRHDVCHLALRQVVWTTGVERDAVHVQQYVQAAADRRCMGLTLTRLPVTRRRQFRFCQWCCCSVHLSRSGPVAASSGQRACTSSCCSASASAPQGPQPATPTVWRHVRHHAAAPCQHQRCDAAEQAATVAPSLDAGSGSPPRPAAGPRCPPPPAGVPRGCNAVERGGPTDAAQAHAKCAATWGAGEQLRWGQPPRQWLDDGAGAVNEQRCPPLAARCQAAAERSAGACPAARTETAGVGPSVCQRRRRQPVPVRQCC